jgi:CRP/FNR family transcriptional regulator
MQSATATFSQIHRSSSAAPTLPFGGLSGEAKTHLNSIAMETNYTRGTRLFHEDEAPKSVFVVLSGRIKLSVTSREGKTVILRIAGAGDLLGLSAALSGNKHEMSAEVVEPCRVKAIRAKDFLAFLQKYPEASKEATRCILNEYQATFSNMCRLANLLLEWLDDRLEKGSKERRLVVPLTHEEIAGMANTSRETVSRVLHQFQREKLIAVNGVSMTVLQPQLLQQLAF